VKKRIASLDVLRALAVIQVIGYHLALPVFGPLGSLGVDLFFALSGFFISGILFTDFEQHGTIRLGRFWMNRAFKILPPLYVFLLAMLLVVPKQKTWEGVVHSALFSMNYLPVNGPVLHTWSLSLEEQFYAFLPLLLVLLIRLLKKPMDSIPWVFLVIVIVTFVLRIPNTDGAPFHLRADGLFVGVFIRYLSSYRPRVFQVVAKFSLVPGLLVWVPGIMLPFYSGLAHSALFVCIDIGCGCLVAWCYVYETFPFWNWVPIRILAAIGVCSYSTYLWQQPIVTIFRFGLGGSPLMLLAGFILCLVAGWIMYRLVEVPSMRARKWVQSRRETPAPVEAEAH